MFKTIRVASSRSPVTIVGVYSGQTSLPRGLDLSAALGKLQISKLRSDYMNSGAETKTLRDFHDAFLGCGEPPLRLVRLLLLGGDEGRTLPD